MVRMQVKAFYRQDAKSAKNCKRKIFGNKENCVLAVLISGISF
jgi:hypothetical protein